jgi:hypothetical protein
VAKDRGVADTDTAQIAVGSPDRRIAATIARWITGSPLRSGLDSGRITDRHLNESPGAAST